MKEPRELEKRDVFYFRYGYSPVKFIVKHCNQTGVLVTSNNWLKADVVFLSYAELEREQSYCYIGRYSKLRWWLKV